MANKLKVRENLLLEFDILVFDPKHKTGTPSMTSYLGFCRIRFVWQTICQL